MMRVLHPRGRIAAKIDNYRPFDATLTIYTGAERPLRPALMAVDGTGIPTLEVEIFPTDDAGAGQRLADAIASDRAVVPEDLRHAPFVVRAKVRVNDNGEMSTFTLDLGGDIVAAVGSAVVDLDDPKPASICSHSVQDLEVYAPGTRKAEIAPNASNVQFGSGWNAAERRVDGRVFRWTGARSVLLVPLNQPRSTVITVLDAGLSYPNRPPGSVTLIVNGHPLASLPLSVSGTLLAWTAPEYLLRDGLNELVFDVTGAASPAMVNRSSDTRLLGLSVKGIEIAESGAISP